MSTFCRQDVSGTACSADIYLVNPHDDPYISPRHDKTDTYCSYKVQIVVYSFYHELTNIQFGGQKKVRDPRIKMLALLD